MEEWVLVKLYERRGMRVCVCVCVCVCVVFSLRYNDREHLCRRKETPFPPPSFLTQTLQQCSVIV